MKNVRKIARNPILGSTVLFSFMFMSCSGDTYLQEDQQSVSVNVKNTTLSGKDIFKDIFFFQGPFTDSYPALKEHKAKINAFGTSESVAVWTEINSFADEVMAYIDQRDPKYFSNFKTVITSGDNYAITDAIVEATALMEAAAFSSEKYGSYMHTVNDIMTDPVLSEEIMSLDLSTEGGRARLAEIMEASSGQETSLIPCIPGGFFCVVSIVAGVVSYVAAGYTAIAVAQVLWKVKYWPKDSKGNTTLETQQFVNDLSLFYQA